MALDSSFKFGVELELLLGCRKKTFKTWKSFATDISKRLLKAGICNHINESNDMSLDNYCEWSIAQEVTIPSQPGKNLWGVELVSPIYHVQSGWGLELDIIFAALSSAGFLPHPSAHCSTHVHISGTPDPLSPSELTALARAALTYESALDALVPTLRRGHSSHYWCQSSRVSPLLRGLSLNYATNVVNEAGANAIAIGSNVPIVEAMNLFPAASPYGRAHGRTEDFVRGKVYKWNFEGMLPGGRQTVEFRLPPGCVDGESARGWLELAIAFVASAAAGESDAICVGSHAADLHDLQRLLAAGAVLLGWEDMSACDTILAQRE